jgi:signal transduction histidine kinase/CheY-like chemotaxis protein
MTDSAPEFDDLWTESGLLDVRRQALQEIGIVSAAVAIVGTPLLSALFGGVSAAALAVVLGLFLTGVAAYTLAERFPYLAITASLVGFAAILAALSSLLPAGALLPWYTVVILLAGFLGGPRVGAVLACLGMAMLLLGFPFGTFGLAFGIRFSIALLLWVAAALSWLAFRPLLVALRWSWGHYLDLRQANELLKDRQGELNRVLKSLNETLYQLDRVNHELDRARRAANQARELKSEFAVNVSHELRTPLNLIIGFSEMMVTAPQSYHGQVLPPAYQEDALAIYRSARHLSDLVDDILDLGQIEAGRMALHREHVRLDAVIAEAIETVRVLFAQKGLTLESRISAELPPMFADRTRLRQIVINLLGNAARYTDRGGASVEAMVEERDVAIVVSDTGPGITAAELPRVFDEFWQGSDSRRRTGGGGVGLAVSKRFVEMHGGSIWVESELGHGTTFRFRIPRGADIPEMGTPRPWETWARLRQGTDERDQVAVVSSDRSVQHLFERYLDDYQIVPIADTTALSLFPRRQDLFAVILAAADSLTAHRRGLGLRAQVPDVPVIACGLTGPDRSFAERLGVASYLMKPVGRERLQQILGSLPRPVRRALVVDDDPDAARLLARMIRSVAPRCGARTVFSGTDALRAVEEQRPDVVFADLVMPDVDGYTLIEALRNDSRFADLPVVAVSAVALSVNPLASDGLIFLQPGGIPVGPLFDCLRYSLGLLGERAKDHATVGIVDQPAWSPA